MYKMIKKKLSLFTPGDQLRGKKLEEVLTDDIRKIIILLESKKQEA
jgi:hypothetical protein